MNADSSRSHSIFIVQVETSQPSEAGEILRQGVLNLVDLAGSERQVRLGTGLKDCISLDTYVEYYCLTDGYREFVFRVDFRVFVWKCVFYRCLISFSFSLSITKQGKTGATGQRLKEAAKINLSLSALGNVISALVAGTVYTSSFFIHFCRIWCFCGAHSMICYYCRVFTIEWTALTWSCHWNR